MNETQFFMNMSFIRLEKWDLNQLSNMVNLLN